MNGDIAICITASALLLACANNASPNGSVIFNPELAAAQSQQAAALAKKRSVLSLEGGRKASDCMSYFDMTARYRMDEGVQNEAVKSEYLVCDAMKIPLPIPHQAPSSSMSPALANNCLPN